MQTLLRFSVTQRLRKIKPKFTVRCFSDWDFGSGGFSGDDNGGSWSRDSSGSNDSSNDGFFSNWFSGTEEGASTTE